MNEKQVKVSLCIPENSHYVEVWEVLSRNQGIIRYYGRYTYQDDGTWYYISDPFGFCELSHPVPENVMFICCGKDGSEYCRYSNADPNPLPKFETAVKEAWEKAKRKLEVMAGPDRQQEFWLSLVGLTGDRFKRWLLSFKDPEKYAKEIDAMYGYDENWLHARNEECSCEPIPGTSFTYMGARYCFSRIAMRHKICGVTWTEYRCTKEQPEWSDIYRRTANYGLFGYNFNPEAEGPMYDKHTAVSLIMKALKLGMPSDSGYYVVTEKGDYQTLERYGGWDLAEHMLKGNYRKTIVNNFTDVLANTKNPFPGAWMRSGNEVICPASKANTKTLKTMYPDIPEWRWYEVF